MADTDLEFSSRNHHPSQGGSENFRRASTVHFINNIVVASVGGNSNTHNDATKKLGQLKSNYFLGILHSFSVQYEIFHLYTYIHMYLFPDGYTAVSLRRKKNLTKGRGRKKTKSVSPDL